MDAELRNVSTFLRDRCFHVSSEWLEGCIEFFKSQGQRYSLAELQEFVVDQWKLIDLRQMRKCSLPPNVSNNLKMTLNGKFALQVESVLDIAQPAYTQLQKFRKVNTENIDVTNTKTQSWEPRPSRILQLSMCDGVQEVKGIEYKPIRKLDEILLPGTKVLVIGPVVCRRGVLLLEERNLQIIGGEVDSMIVPNATENILARKLRLEENPSPYSGTPLSSIDSAISSVNPSSDMSSALSAINHVNTTVLPSVTQGMATASSGALTASAAHTHTKLNVPNKCTTTSSAQIISKPVARVSPQLDMQSDFFDDVTFHSEIDALEDQFKNEFCDFNEDPMLLDDELDKHFASLENCRKFTKSNVSQNCVSKGNASIKSDHLKNAIDNSKNENVISEVDNSDTYDPFDDDAFLVDDNILDELDNFESAEPSCNLLKESAKTSTVVSNCNADTAIIGSTSNVSNISSDADLLEEDDDILLKLPVSDLNDTLKPVELTMKNKIINKPKQSIHKRLDNQPTIMSFLNKASAINSKHIENELNVKSKDTNIVKKNLSAKRQAKQDICSSAVRRKLSPSLSPSSTEVINISDDSYEHKIIPSSSSSKLTSISNKSDVSKNSCTLEKNKGDTKKNKSFPSSSCLTDSTNTKDNKLGITSKFNLHNMKHKTADIKVNSSTSAIQSTSLKNTISQSLSKNLKNCCLEPKSMDHRPFVYISEILNSSRNLQTYTVKAFVVTLPSALTMQDDKWHLKAKINDGSATLDVEFSDDVLSRIIGYTCEEFNSMKLSIRSNNLVKDQLKNALTDAQQKLINLSGLFDLTFTTPDKPCKVTRIGDATSQDMEMLKEWLKSCDCSH